MKTQTLSALSAALLALAASQAVQAQDAVPPNTWTSSAATSEPAFAPSRTRESVRSSLAGGVPSPFADSPPARGSMHRPLASQVTRAEVQADLQVWRESGLAALEAGEVVAYDSEAYRAAQARYAGLRASPYFASLVQRFASDRAAFAGG